MALLINEPPLMVLPSLAAELGTADEAIVLQQLHYWLQRSNNVRDGHKWVYNSMNDWLKQFPWIKSRKRLTRYFDDLESRGLVVTGNYNKAAFDKTKWYRIDYDALSVLEKRLGQNDPTSESNRPNGESQNDPTDTNRLPETTSETTTNNQAQPDTLAQQRREVIEYLNKKTDSKFKPNAKGNKSVIDPRLKEGYTVDDMKMIIDAMYSKWHGNKFSNGSMGDDYLRPETLFRVSKIEGYLNVARKMKKQQKPDDLFDMGGWIRE